MRFVFYVFLFFVAISTLIVLAAAVRIAWTRVARPMPMSSDSAAQARSPGIGDGLLLAATALAWYNTASGWICQRVVLSPLCRFERGKPSSISCLLPRLPFANCVRHYSPGRRAVGCLRPTAVVSVL